MLYMIWGGMERIPRVHLGDHLELVLDGRDLLSGSGLGAAKAKEGHFGGLRGKGWNWNCGCLA